MAVSLLRLCGWPCFFNSFKGIPPLRHSAGSFWLLMKLGENNFTPLSHWWVWQPRWSWKSPSKLSLLSLKNITYLQQNSSTFQSQNSKILTAFFLFPPAFSGSIFAGEILIPGFCWNGWLNLWVTSMISLLNICSATPFFNMDRLRICQNFKL